MESDDSCLRDSEKDPGLWIMYKGKKISNTVAMIRKLLKMREIQLKVKHFNNQK